MPAERSFTTTSGPSARKHTCYCPRLPSFSQSCVAAVLGYGLRCPFSSSPRFGELCYIFFGPSNVQSLRIWSNPEVWSIHPSSWILDAQTFSVEVTNASTSAGLFATRRSNYGAWEVGGVLATIRLLSNPHAARCFLDLKSILDVDLESFDFH